MASHDSFIFLNQVPARLSADTPSLHRRRVSSAVTTVIKHKECKQNVKFSGSIVHDALLGLPPRSTCELGLLPRVVRCCTSALWLDEEQSHLGLSGKAEVIQNSDDKGGPPEMMTRKCGDTLGDTGLSIHVFE